MLRHLGNREDIMHAEEVGFSMGRRARWACQYRPCLTERGAAFVRTTPRASPTRCGDAGSRHGGTRPAGSKEAYRQEWQRYLADPRQRLTPRALRSLCWEPDVATISRFHEYLDEHVVVLSRRMLPGWCVPVTRDGPRPLLLAR